MMKIAFKVRFGNRVLSLLSITALVMPVMVLAATPQEDRANRQAERQAKQAAVTAERQENREAKKEEMQDKRQELFCSNFADHAAKIAANMTERKNSFEERKTNRAGTVDENRGNRDGKLQDKRSSADERRSEMYAKLEGKADTDAEKEAVAQFKKTVEEAIDDRQDAVNDAIEAFRTGVDAAAATRKDDLQAMSDTFTKAVNSAVEKAKSDCEGGATPATVRTNFQAALNAAREDLQSDRSASLKLKTEVKALADARKVSIEKAVSSFKATLELAKGELKKAFGSNTNL
ncbi:MAG: hypothetical protein KBD27_01735 [Candidatus Moranbacteria bacterium]|nr:hypothetical protein [Candidatus Moranbacteria bacterium]